MSEVGVLHVTLYTYIYVKNKELSLGGRIAVRSTANQSPQVISICISPEENKYIQMIKLSISIKF